MRRWRAYRSLGLWVGILILLALVVSAGRISVELGRALGADPAAWRLDMRTFALMAALVSCLALVGVLFYRLSSARTMSYLLDRNAITITWLGNRYLIPMDQVESADVGVAGARISWFGLRLFGYRRGHGWLTDGRPLHLFITAPLRRCLIIYTRDAAYAISPAASDEFVRELEQLRGLGTIQPMAAGLQRSQRLSYGFWLHSGILLLVLGALVLNLILWAALAWRYEQLPSLLLLRLDPTGGHLQPKHRLLLLPLGALGLSLLNLLIGLRIYLRERGGALLLQSASVLVHLLALAALINLLQ